MQEPQSGNQNPRTDKLIEILEKEIQLSTELLDLLHHEQQALTDMDMQALIALTRKKESLLSRIRLLDESLEETAGRICGASPDTNVKLSDVIARTTGSARTSLTECRKNLAALRQKVLDRNHINKRFAEDIRGYLNDAISMITGSMAGRPMYGGQGVVRPSANQPSLISREV